MRPRGTLRIIGGRWRRRLLAVAATGALRPTPDRVRETLFNWLAPELPGARCLDLFAGTGALGFEAASRGAAHAVLVDRDPRVAAQLERQARELGAHEVRVVCADGPAWALAARERFDIVFVDPPYGSVDLRALLERLDAAGTLAPDALVYIEHQADDVSPVLPEGWRSLRERRAGRVRYHLAAPPVRPATVAEPPHNDP